MNIVINTALGKVFCIFCNSPIVLFTLVVITFKCSSKVNRASRNMSRCFWYGYCEKMLLLKRSEGWQIFLVFLTKNNFLSLFAWVWVKAHFPMESPVYIYIYIYIYMKYQNYNWTINIQQNKIIKKINI